MRASLLEWMDRVLEREGEKILEWLVRVGNRLNSSRGQIDAAIDAAISGAMTEPPPVVASAPYRAPPPVGSVGSSAPGAGSTMLELQASLGEAVSQAYEVGRSFFLLDAPKAAFNARRPSGRYLSEGALLEEIRGAHYQQARLLDALRGDLDQIPEVTSGYRVDSAAHRRGALDFSTKGASPAERVQQAITWSGRLESEDRVVVEELYWVERRAIVANAPREALVRSRRLEVLPSVPARPPQFAGVVPKTATIVQINTSYSRGKQVNRSVTRAWATATHTHVQSGRRAGDSPPR